MLILLHILGLRTSKVNLSILDDVVLIAIDFENWQNFEGDLSLNRESEDGIAILDTRDLKSSARPILDPNSSNLSVENLISTYNLSPGSYEYQTLSSTAFIYGASTNIVQSDMLIHILSLIPPGRNIVFVGHGVSQDLRVLRALGFDFDTNRSSSPYHISCILDTSKLAYEVFGLKELALQKLLGILGCPFTNLHCAGNDANFTLKAASLLACTSWHGSNPILPVLGSRPLSTAPLPVIPSYAQTQQRQKYRVLYRAAHHPLALPKYIHSLSSPSSPEPSPSTTTTATTMPSTIPPSTNPNLKIQNLGKFKHKHNKVLKKTRPKTTKEKGTEKEKNKKMSSKGVGEQIREQELWRDGDERDRCGLLDALCAENRGIVCQTHISDER